MVEQGISKKQAAAEKRRVVQKVTLWGLFVNLALSGIKLLFGILGTSQALVADAVHSLSDSATDVAVIVGARFWTQPADEDHPYGHGRIETMVTFFIGAVLALVGILIAYKALRTIDSPHQKGPGWLVFAAACLSIVSKEFLYQWTVRVGKRVKSSAMMANAWHHRSDSFSSIPVAIAVLGSKIQPSWTFLDHIGAIIVAVLIIQASWHIFWPALKQLSDIGATQTELDRLTALVRQTERVRDVHALRTRNIGPGLQVDLHVLVDPGLSVYKGHIIAGKVKKQLLDQGPDVVDVLVHIEPFEGGTMQDSGAKQNNGASPEKSG
ncbi:MAG: cation-efflux pump [candidate division Zixibacteria bacterium HGW-Zixibacteria-1]|nr:MAG: cation-efflux pump [candidate division Zixibacteria bacterium HGW-Zixibacteria-1]